MKTGFFRKTTSRQKILTGIFVLLFVGLSFMPICVRALDAIEVLQKFDLPQANLLSYPCRQLGWAFIMGLNFLVGEIEIAMYQVTELMGGFTEDENVIRLIAKLTPFLWALLTVIVVYIGITIIVKPKQKIEILQNSFVSIFVLCAMPVLLSQGFNLTKDLIDYIRGDNDLLSEQIVSSNVIDVSLYDATDFKSVDLDPKNYGTSDINLLGINEMIYGDDETHSDVWKKTLKKDKEGNYYLKKVKTFKIGWGDEIDFLGERYYRYKVDWFNIICCLLITGAALGLSSVKSGRLLYELAINKMLANCAAFLDVQNGQRLKKVIQSIISTLFTLVGITWLFQLYIVGQAFVSGFSLIPKIICMLAMAWAVIDGPYLFEQIVGVDAGVKSALATVYGMKAVGSALKGVDNAIRGQKMMDGSRQFGFAQYAKSGFQKAQTAGGKIAGGLSGFAQGTGKSISNKAKELSSGPQKGMPDNSSKTGSQGQSAANGLSTGSAEADTASGNNGARIQAEESGSSSMPDSSPGGNDNQSTPSADNGFQSSPNDNSSSSDVGTMTMKDYMKNKGKGKLMNSPLVQSAKRANDQSRQLSKNSADKFLRKSTLINRGEINQMAKSRRQENPALNSREARKEVREEFKNRNRRIDEYGY